MIRLALGALLLGVLANAAEAADPKLLFHARRASMAQPCQANLSRCQDVDVLGQLYAPSGAGNYYVYLVAAGIDPAQGLASVSFGIDYDAVTVSGVDLFTWNLCADSEEPGTGWYQEAHSSNRISWNAESCPAESLVVGGYFYMTCYTASFLTVGPVGDDPVTFRDCQSQDVTLPQSSLGHVAFGATGGCNPCLGPCDKVAVTATTWSGIKTLNGPDR
ncbi:MAG TPA: hypothetical protein VF720_08885 [Candidatus Eisenbacteria bacterium]